MALHLIPGGDPPYDHQAMPCCICHPDRAEGRRPNGTHGATFTHREMTTAGDERQEGTNDAATRRP